MTRASFLVAFLFFNGVVYATGVSDATVDVVQQGNDEVSVCVKVKHQDVCPAPPPPPENSCATNPIRDCSCFTDKAYAPFFERDIKPLPNGPTFKALCAPDDNGHIWTAVQFREGNPLGAVSFDRTFAEYKAGFGKSVFYSGDFFIGLDKLYALTNAADFGVKIETVDTYWETYVIAYDQFRVGDEASQYTLSVSQRNPLSTAGTISSLASDSNGQKFSAKDKDNGCASKHKGGWWFKPSAANACSSLRATNPYDNSALAGKMAFDLDGVNELAHDIRIFVKPSN